MAKLQEKIVIPGENITTEEEYAPGANTFTTKGLVKSKATGKIVFDDSTKEVHVIGNSVKGITVGDIVYGKVTLVKESSAIIELKSAENNKKVLTPTAMLPVRNISTEFISDIHQVIKVGDLVKAKIVNISPLGTDLATNETGLGVIKAYCSNCRHELTSSGGKLICFNCGSTEERRWFENELKPREYTPREDFGERRSFGGGYNRPRGNFRDNRGFNDRNNRSSFGPRRSFQKSPRF